MTVQTNAKRVVRIYHGNKLVYKDTAFDYIPVTLDPSVVGSGYVCIQIDANDPTIGYLMGWVAPKSGLNIPTHNQVTFGTIDTQKVITTLDSIGIIVLDDAGGSTVTIVNNKLVYTPAPNINYWTDGIMAIMPNRKSNSTSTRVKIS